MVAEMAILEDGYLIFQDVGQTVKDPFVCHEHCVLCKEIGERLRIVAGSGAFASVFIVSSLRDLG